MQIYLVRLYIFFLWFLIKLIHSPIFRNYLSFPHRWIKRHCLDLRSLSFFPFFFFVVKNNLKSRVASEYISHATLWEWTCRQIEIDYTLICSENELVLTHVSKFLNWFSSLLLYIQISFNYELNASFKMDLFYNW